jgi:hypothetical protein
VALAIFTFKSILRQKKKNYEKLKYFTHAKNIIFKNILQKRNQNPSSFYNCRTNNLKFCFWHTTAAHPTDKLQTNLKFCFRTQQQHTQLTSFKLISSFVLAHNSSTP